MLEYPLYEIVLVAPEIPQNTGNIGRIACCTGCRLHLIEPISFSFEDKYLRRAGMDYWHHVDCIKHPDWESIFAVLPKANETFSVNICFGVIVDFCSA